MNKKSKALIFGICGQDGSYLAKSLIKKGFTVFGTSRDSLNANRVNLKKLNLENEVEIISTQINNYRSVLKTIKYTAPDYIFHMAGQTSVGLSFERPFESIESIAISTLNILDVVKFLDEEINIFIPCSSECFGNSGIDNPANENTVLNPLSPYAVAKCSSFWLAKSYRDAYAMKISVAFLSNHESPLRGDQFVLSKLFKEIKNIEKKKSNKIHFGDIDIIRDWGWAPDYVEGIINIATNKVSEDFIIGTGKSYSLREIIRKTFELINIHDYQKYISTSKKATRPNELISSYLDPSKAKEKLNWESKTNIDLLIKKLYDQNLY